MANNREVAAAAAAEAVAIDRCHVSFATGETADMKRRRRVGLGGGGGGGGGGGVGDCFFFLLR